MIKQSQSVSPPKKRKLNHLQPRNGNIKRKGFKPPKIAHLPPSKSISHSASKPLSKPQRKKSADFDRYLQGLVVIFVVMI